MRVSLTPKGLDLHREVLPLQRAVLARMLAGDSATCDRVAGFSSR